MSSLEQRFEAQFTHGATETLGEANEREMDAFARVKDRNTCGVCGEQAQVQIFKERGYCGEEHRKELARIAQVNDEFATDLDRVVSGE